MAIGYEAVPGWFHRPSPVTWDGTPGVAVDAQDTVYVYTRGSPPIQVYDAQGRYVRGWGQNVIKAAHGIAVDGQGHVWGTDIECHVVRKFSPEGRLLLTLGTEGQPGEDDAHFNQPTGVAVGKSGDVFIADGYGNNRIVHVDKQGRFVKAWGKLGNRPGEFSCPHAIGVDSKERVYVADRNNARIQVFQKDGTFLAEWRHIMVPWGLCVTKDDEVWVCGSSPMRWPKGEGQFGSPPKDQIVVKFNDQGRVLQLWSIPKGTEGQDAPGYGNVVHGIAVDSKGNLYVGEIAGRRAQKFVRLE